MTDWLKIVVPPGQNPGRPDPDPAPTPTRKPDLEPEDETAGKSPASQTGGGLLLADSTGGHYRVVPWPGDDYMDVEGVMRAAGVSKKTVDNWCARGLLKYAQPGGLKGAKRLFPLGEVERLLALRGGKPGSGEASGGDAESVDGREGV